MAAPKKKSMTSGKVVTKAPATVKSIAKQMVKKAPSAVLKGIGKQYNTKKK